jgi:hypothetical protein
MNRSQSIDALRRANPRARAGFASSVAAAGVVVRVHLDSMPTAPSIGRQRRRALRISVAGVSLATAAATLIVAIGMPAGSGVESATAAFRRAATVTAASAERSGTAVVRITHDGEAWAGTTVSWNGEDVAVGRDDGRQLRVVDGTLYGPNPEGGWLELGDPASIDPDSGTTPAEYLATVREDVGGETLRRITGAMTGLTTTQLADGSTVYRGSVASGVIARETGFKEGHAIRVLPFGFVAHGEAADAAAPLDVAVSVGADAVVREIALTWGPEAWRYVVTYTGLGSTSAPVAPAHAKSLQELRRPVPPRVAAPGNGN